MLSHDSKWDRESRIWPKAVAVATILYQRLGIAVIAIAGGTALILVSCHSGARLPASLPGSGIAFQRKVTVVWIPKALRDIAEGRGESLGSGSAEAVRTELKRRGLDDAWYAITYPDYQVVGRSGELMQTRRLSEAADHLDEFERVMATAAGRRPGAGRDSWHARVEIIPDAFQSLEPREAMARLTTEPVPPNESLPGRDPLHSQKSE